MNTETKAGWVYIMTNDLYADLIKIGMIAEHPEVRAYILSKQTASAGTFNVEWGLKISDYKLAENLIKSALKRFHHNKEYYKTSVDEAKKLIEDSLSKYFLITEKHKYYPVVYISPNHNEMDEHKRKRKIQLAKALALDLKKKIKKAEDKA